MPGKFTSIPGVSDQRRLPRLGKIRLGIKKKSGGGKEYPAETDYFVVPEEVAKVYGDQPKKLDVMLPVVDQAVVFPVAYKAYKRSGLFCIGNGEFAERRAEGEWKQRECPCPMLEQRECRRSATLSVVLPKVNIGGVYQIVTGSIHSIMDVLSGMDYARALLQGKVAWQPLVLERIEKEVTYTDPKDNKPKKRKHYTMSLTFEGDVDFANKLIATNKGILTDATYLLPGPNLNPHDDPPDLIEEGEEEIQQAEARVVDDPKGDAEAAANAPDSSSGDGESANHADARKNFTRQLLDLCKRLSDDPVDLFAFFIKEHLGCESSNDVPLPKLLPIIDECIRMADIPDPEQRNMELEEYKLCLKQEKGRTEQAGTTS